MKPSPAVGVRSFRAVAMADLPSLAAFVDTACDALGADGEVRFAMRLAVEEVFTNIIEHGYGGKGPVLVEVDGGPRCVRVRLSDEAPAFDPADAPAPDLEAPLAERDPGGLGWHLVHQLMDEVEHKPAPPRGNTYTLVKQLPAPAPGA